MVNIVLYGKDFTERTKHLNEVVELLTRYNSGLILLIIKPLAHDLIRLVCEVTQDLFPPQIFVDDGCDDRVVGQVKVTITQRLVAWGIVPIAD